MGYNFIDLFAGCGGLSLGLKTTGWKGLFAIEKNQDAFETLKHNFSNKYPFEWPDWLPFENIDINYLLVHYRDRLYQLKGKVDMIAGGPPCQGFSYAGKRDAADPRNSLCTSYLNIVELVEPKIILFENVKGFTSGFKVQNSNGITKKTKPVSEQISDAFTKLGYKVFSNVISASDIGVPQSRHRFVMIAIKHDIINNSVTNEIFFDKYMNFVSKFKEEKKLPKDKVTVRMAIDDLSITNNKIIPSRESHGFNEIEYLNTSIDNSYLKIMRNNCNKPSNLRLANHKESTIKRMRYILSHCSRGKSIDNATKEYLNIKKQTTIPLDPDGIAPTITTHPDDIIHYSEPRILTVRELARLQSFPDWFEFKGKYTTGGLRRRNECPKYTQVGNAVPPLLAESLGKFIMKLLNGEL
ncbi:MAG: DNA cytosine methyltransferase [Deferribacterales bacterium]